MSENITPSIASRHFMSRFYLWLQEPAPLPSSNTYMVMYYWIRHCHSPTECPSEFVSSQPQHVLLQSTALSCFINSGTDSEGVFLQLPGRAGVCSLVENASWHDMKTATNITRLKFAMHVRRCKAIRCSVPDVHQASSTLLTEQGVILD